MRRARRVSAMPWGSRSRRRRFSGTEYSGTRTIMDKKHLTDACACAEYNAMTRRDFLARGTAAAIVASTPAWLPRVAYAQTDVSGRDIIVYIFLRGGMDGLSLV